MSHSSRGYSIAEIVVSLLLMGIAMSMVASLAGLFSDSSRRLQSKEAAQEAGRQIKRRLQADVRSAIQVHTPSASGTSPNLVLDLLDPSLADTRLPTVFPDPLPTTWQPHDASFRMTVEYFVDAADILYRRATGSNGTVTQEMGGDIAGFSSELLTPELLNVRFSINAGGLIQSESLEIPLIVGRI